MTVVPRPPKNVTTVMLRLLVSVTTATPRPRENVMTVMLRPLESITTVTPRPLESITTVTNHPQGNVMTVMLRPQENVMTVMSLPRDAQSKVKVFHRRENAQSQVQGNALSKKLTTTSHLPDNSNRSRSIWTVHHRGGSSQKLTTTAICRLLARLCRRRQA